MVHYPNAQTSAFGQQTVAAPTQVNTRMEQLGRDLSDSAARLNGAADRLERRLAFYLGAPTQGETGGKANPSSPPGTHAALDHASRDINTHAERIEKALEVLTTIL